MVSALLNLHHSQSEAENLKKLEEIHSQSEAENIKKIGRNPSSIRHDTKHTHALKYIYKYKTNVLFCSTKMAILVFPLDTDTTHKCANKIRKALQW